MHFCVVKLLYRTLCAVMAGHSSFTNASTTVVHEVVIMAVATHSLMLHPKCIVECTLCTVWVSRITLHVVRSPVRSSLEQNHTSLPMCAEFLTGPQIFTRAIEWPSLASASPTGDLGPPYNFFSKGGGKIGLSCSELATVTLKPNGAA